jgi:hypothetical protein
MGDSSVPATFIFPDGVVPNYINPEHRGKEITITAIVFTAITALFILCRMYTRLWIIRSFGKDDGECLPLIVTMLWSNQLPCSLYPLRLGERPAIGPPLDQSSSD